MPGEPDTYTLRLTKAPTDPVTVDIFTDGQTHATIGGPVFLDALDLDLDGADDVQTLDITFADNGPDAQDTLTRASGSWKADGYRVGMLISVANASNAANNGVFRINGISGTAADAGDVLILSSKIDPLAAAGSQLSEAQLVDETASVEVTPLAPAIAFDNDGAGGDDWFDEQTVTVEADPFFNEDGPEFEKKFELTDHLLNRIQGPLVIEGGVDPDADRSLRVAVMLPYESAADPLDVSIVTDETVQTDTLNIFNDTSQADGVGALTISDDNGTLGRYNLSGFGMGGDLTLDISDEFNPPELVTWSGGISYAEIEVAEVMLGSGNDTLTIDTPPVSAAASFDFVDGGTAADSIVRSDGGSFIDDGFVRGRTIEVSGSSLNDGLYRIANVTDTTLTFEPGTQLTADTGDSATVTVAGPITVIHGGGNSLERTLTVPTPDGDRVVSGDYIKVIEAGGPSAPLVIYGDTSQDGSRYDSTAATATGNAVTFKNAGDDVIDASSSTLGVTIYGGNGNDVIYGSQGGRQSRGWLRR